MQKDEVLVVIQKIGNENLSEYETAGGYLDIFIGIILITLFFFLKIHSYWFWLGLAVPLCLIELLILQSIRKKLIVPRIGVANFTILAGNFKNRTIQYGMFFIIIPVYMIWMTVDPQGLPSANAVAIINFGLIPRSFGQRVWYYFMAAFMLAPLVYPYYRNHYSDILLGGGMLLFFILVTPWMWKNVKQRWEPCIIPKPKNINQAMLVFIMAFLVEFILFTLFKHDVSSIVRNWFFQNLIFGIGLFTSIIIVIIGLAYKIPRMYLYSLLIITLTSLANMINTSLQNSRILFLISGIIILISGIRFFIQFIKKNPIMSDENLLEEKVLDDTE
jgi:hypothetical protein